MRLVGIWESQSDVDLWWIWIKARPVEIPEVGDFPLQSFWNAIEVVDGEHFATPIDPDLVIKPFDEPIGSISTPGVDDVRGFIENIPHAEHDFAILAMPEISQQGKQLATEASWGVIDEKEVWLKFHDRSSNSLLSATHGLGEGKTLLPGDVAPFCALGDRWDRDHAHLRRGLIEVRPR